MVRASCSGYRVVTVVRRLNGLKECLRMIRWRRTLLVVTALVAALPAVTMSSDAPNERRTLAAIYAAAEQRARSLSAVRASVMVEHWISADDLRQQPSFVPADQERAPIPDAGLRYRGRGTLSLDGMRFRISRAGDIPQAESVKLVPFESLDIGDGEQIASIQPPSTDRKFWFFTLRDDRPPLTVDLIPFVWHTRLRDSEWVPASKTIWGVAAEREQIGASNCVIVAYGDGTSTFAFDPENNWVLRRMRRESKEGGSVEILVEYTQPSGLKSRPLSWKREFRSAGKLTGETKVKVIEWEVDPEWAKDAFEIEYPSRSLIMDQRAQRDPEHIYRVIDAAGNSHDPTSREVTAGKHIELLK